MNELVARWFAAHLKAEDKRDAFYAALLARLDCDPYISILWANYGPNLPVINALRDVDLQVSKYFDPSLTHFDRNLFAQKKSDNVWTMEYR